MIGREREEKEPGAAWWRSTPLPAAGAKLPRDRDEGDGERETGEMT